MKLTQYQKILEIMRKQPDKWFYPYEFMRPDLGDLFVGYKAPTRIAELDKKYPQLFDRMIEGKYTKRKLNMQVYDYWFPKLPVELQIIFDANAASPKPKQKMSEVINERIARNSPDPRLF